MPSSCKDCSKPLERQEQDESAREFSFTGMLFLKELFVVLVKIGLDHDLSPGIFAFKYALQVLREIAGIVRRLSGRALHER